MRSSHEKHHHRPWKCNVPTCEYASGGFLSRKMRDDHLNRYHQTQKPKPDVAPIHSDPDEIEPLLADLIQANSVDAVRALLPSFLELPWTAQRELQMLAAAYGSLSLLDLIIGAGKSDQLSLADSPSALPDAASRAIGSHNSKALEFILFNFCLDKALWIKNFEQILRHVWHSDSMDIHHVWENYATNVRLTFKDAAGPKESLRFAKIHTSRYILSAVVNDPYNEQMMLRLWKKKSVAKALRQNPDCLGIALNNVAVLCCSVQLAQYLIEAGAKVDYRMNDNWMTALHHAARKSSVESAEFMRLLLQCGADPDGFTNLVKGTVGDRSRSRRREYIRDEKGAKEISKWLGITWDELVAQTKREREEQSQKGTGEAREGHSGVRANFQDYDEQDRKQYNDSLVLFDELSR